MTTQSVSRFKLVSHVSGRALSAFGVTFSFLPMLASGAILYFAPKGRLSKQTDWDVLGLDRHEWADIHSVLMTLFVGFSLWHAILHLRVLKSLIFGNKVHHFGHWVEAIVAGVLVLGFMGMAIWHLPPASWVLELSDFFKHSFWVQ
ncbi:protein of unknown function [Shimia gijangensis]|uniref:Flavinylation-associated cytochrome domain-containing protein n=1 Tax=Shimia gijangensis TaxID=1470563 RepID=A0A1M6QEB1_9RHOB|nr:DUF4405 domain-containing protein [Shimia gijangensis]SHK18582.1 protein of unknown function [Shimia gijangensis]